MRQEQIDAVRRRAAEYRSRADDLSRRKGVAATREFSDLVAGWKELAEEWEKSIRVRSRPFPVQPQRGIAGPLEIPWTVAEKAYGVYAARYGRGQSLDCLAERGGFGVREMDEFYPAWRDEASENEELRSKLADAEKVIERILSERDEVQRENS